MDGESGEKNGGLRQA